MIGLNIGAQVFGAIKGGAIDMNAALETSTLQFTTLMGNSDAARKHVEGLFDFAAKTPFETGPIIEASRIMRTFGGAALDTKENLTTFGDAAAATGSDIGEVGMWMSRAYANIQAGRPFGEAAQRLSELGILTPDVRNKLEDMSKAGKSSGEIWGSLTGSLGKFDGAMERQSTTFDGMLSTFTDGVGIMLATAMKPLFEGFKGALKWVNALMSSDAFNGAIYSIGRGLAATFSAIGSAIGAVWSVVQPLIQAFGYIVDVLVSGDDVASGLSETLGNLGEKFMGLATTIQTAVLGALTGVLQQIPAFTTAFFDLAGAAVNTFVAMAPSLLAAVLAFLQTALDWIITTGVPLAATALGDFALKFIDWVGPAAEKLAALLPGIGEKILAFIGANAPILAGKLIEWAGAFLGWIAKNVLPRLPGLLATVGGAILTWLGGVALTLGAAALKMGGEFVTNLMGFLGTLPGKIGEVFLSIIRAVGGFAGQVASSFGNMAIKAGKAFANGIVGLIEGAVNAVIRGLNSFQIHFAGIDLGPAGHVGAVNWNGFQLGRVNLPRFATGSIDTGSRSFVGIIDPHEAILPKAAADQWRAGRGNGGAMTVVIQIENYTGTEDHLDRLSRDIGQTVRRNLPRRTLTAGNAF